MVHITHFMKTGLTSKISQISEFQNHPLKKLSCFYLSELIKTKQFAMTDHVLGWSRNGVFPPQFGQTPSIGVSQGSRLPEYVQQISQTSSFGASHISRITESHQFVPHPDPGKWY